MGLSKEEAKHTLRNHLRDVAGTWASPEGKSLSEAMTRRHFIDRYIDCLGYEGINDVELEHPVKNTGKFIDYVLRIEGQPVLAVEAKPLGAALSDDVGAQLLEYQVVENIEWGVATNAREVWVYYLYLQGPPREKCVMKLDLLLDDLDRKLDMLFDRFWLLSKESMSTGVGLRSLIKESQLERAIEGALLHKTSRIVHALRMDVKDRTQGKIKVTPDEVVSWLRNRLAKGLAPATSPVTQGAPTTAPPSRPPGEVTWTSEELSQLWSMITDGARQIWAKIAEKPEGHDFADVVRSTGMHGLQVAGRLSSIGHALREFPGKEHPIRRDHAAGQYRMDPEMAKVIRQLAGKEASGGPTTHRD